MNSASAPQHDEDQVSRDVMELLLLSYTQGFDALIRTFAVNGLVSPEQIENIHTVMAPPLDHEELAGDETLAFLRENFDNTFAQARAVATKTWAAPD